MNIYIIDDNLQKYKNLSTSLELANTLLEKDSIATRFDLGFGEKPGLEGGFWKDKNNADLYLNALKDKEGLFLIDISIDGSEHFAKYILDKLPENVRHRYEEITNESRLLDPKYKLAIATLAACEVLELRSLLASTNTSLGDVVRLEKFGFVSFSRENPVESLMELKKEDDLVFAWAKALIGTVNFDFFEDIQAKTKDWFVNAEYNQEKDILGHDYRNNQFPSDEIRRVTHMAIVLSKFPWFKESWWDTDESAEQLHNCLKGFCGSSMLWNIGFQPLKLSGVYFLFLYLVENAIRKTGLDSALLDDFMLDDLSCFSHDGKLIPFMPTQTSDDAKSSFIALGEFIESICLKKDTKELSFKSITGPVPPFRYTINVPLTWSKALRVDFGSQLSQSITQKQARLRLQKGKASVALINFILLSQNNIHGFGSVAGISLDESNVLTFGYGV